MDHHLIAVHRPITGVVVESTVLHVDEPEALQVAVGGVDLIALLAGQSADPLDRDVLFDLLVGQLVE
jgi:hypothetical protein